MAVIVTKDIAHPQAQVSTDWSTGKRIDKAVRVFSVENLDDGSSTQSATALARALQAFGVPPRGTSLGNGGPAVVVGYSSQQMPNTDNAALLYINYDTPTASGGGSGGFVSSDSTVEIESTTQLHPAMLRPLAMSWSDPADPNAATQDDVVSMSYPDSLRSLVVEGVFTEAFLDGTVRPSVNKVNNAKWHGLGVAYWRFINISSALTIGSSSGNVLYAAQFSLATHSNRDWSSYAVFRDTHTGKFKTVARADTLAAQGVKYDFDIIYNKPGKGILRAGMYDLANFLNLFGIA